MSDLIKVYATWGGEPPDPFTSFPICMFTSEAHARKWATGLTPMIDALAEALLYVEWRHTDPFGDLVCNDCERRREPTEYQGIPYGHTDSCQLDAALKLVGFHDQKSRDAMRERLKSPAHAALLKAEASMRQNFETLGESMKDTGDALPVRATAAEDRPVGALGPAERWIRWMLG